MKISNSINPKIGLKRALLGITITACAIGAGTSITKNIKEAKEKKEFAERFQQQTDSIMRERGIDIHDMQGRLKIQHEFTNNCLRKAAYNLACETYGLDPECTATPQQLQELKVLEFKADSIKNNNAHKAYEELVEKLNNRFNALSNIE